MKAFISKGSTVLFLVFDKNVINDKSKLPYLEYILTTKIKNVSFELSSLKTFKDTNYYIEISIKDVPAMLNDSLKTLTFKTLFEVYPK